ncbi:unnamed protein product [Darwinula stevensoni]|uniref:Uncharacterized protein n=1 Tax=Darwinula stevensoni TaxID=69355 RepID=A0A7R9FN96_9CRUS|nr:unnamed protein product [Darwinula stevensoni]CAG0896571.1 unnamed protein product [Darwinula stevensoni]
MTRMEDMEKYARSMTKQAMETRDDNFVMADRIVQAMGKEYQGVWNCLVVVGDGTDNCFFSMEGTPTLKYQVEDKCFSLWKSCDDATQRHGWMMQEVKFCNGVDKCTKNCVDVISGEQTRNWKETESHLLLQLVENGLNTTEQAREMKAKLTYREKMQGAFDSISISQRDLQEILTKLENILREMQLVDILHILDKV